MGNDLDHVLLTEKQIHARLEELAGEIWRDYHDKDVLLVLTGNGDVLEPDRQQPHAVVVTAQPDVVDPGDLTHVLDVRHDVLERGHRLRVRLLVRVDERPVCREVRGAHTDLRCRV